MSILWHGLDAHSTEAFSPETCNHGLQSIGSLSVLYMLLRDATCMAARVRHTHAPTGYSPPSTKGHEYLLDYCHVQDAAARIPPPCTPRRWWCTYTIPTPTACSTKGRIWGGFKRSMRRSGLLAQCGHVNSRRGYAQGSNTASGLGGTKHLAASVAGPGVDAPE